MNRMTRFEFRLWLTLVCITTAAITYAIYAGPQAFGIPA